jgi:ElaB/YqjD/DUF883 family membrane-anchored ribosome-binding protein
MTPGGAHGSGSDTLSAANISAGTSVGNAGQPATPQDQRGTSGQGSAGSFRQGSTGSSGSLGSAGQMSSGQGTAGSTGSGGWNQTQGGRSGDVGGSGRSAQGVGETLARSAQSASDTARQTASDLSDRAGDALEDASDWARDQYEQGSRQFERVRGQSMQQFRQARGGIERFVNENPLMVGVVGLAAGLVIGALLPRTRQEDRAFGQWADQVRDQGWRYAREATQRGREYMEEALGGDNEDERGEWRPGEGGDRIRSSGPRYQNH